MKMEVGKRMEMLERKSSIETEPMTLHLDQIEHAREEALFVMKTKTFQEAMDIFTKVVINSFSFFFFVSSTL